MLTHHSVNVPTLCIKPKNRLFEHALMIGFGQDIIIAEDDEAVTAEFLLPARGEILSLFKRLREEVDLEIRASFTKSDLQTRQDAHLRTPSEYPVGWCAEIVEMVFDKLVCELKGGERSPALNAIRRATRAQATLAKVYGVVSDLQGTSFQNAIQLGSWLIDCALNTIPPASRSAVDIFPAQDGPLRNIDSLHLHFKTAHEYWGHQIFSSAPYLPNLAPFCPAIMLSSSDSLIIQLDDSQFFRNLFSGFRLSESFLDEQHRSGPRLPERYLPRLREMAASRGPFWSFRYNHESPTQLLRPHKKHLEEALNAEDSPRTDLILRQVLDAARSLDRGVMC